MNRKNYDEIKKKFGNYISIWKTREIEKIDEIFIPNVRTYMSTAIKMPNGSQDSIFGIRDFINDFPQTDIFRPKIYNYVCRFNENEGQQYAEVHCVALNFRSDSDILDNFEFVCMISNHWIHTSEGWKIDLMKMDVAPMYGSLRKLFEKSWYLQDSIGLDHSPRLNCIIGEIDSPWEVIKNSESVLSDKEKIKETMSKYAYGEDQMVFLYCYDAFSDYYGVGGQMTNREGKIHWITNIKNKRVRDRYWVHPFKFVNIEIDGDRAYAIVERPTGHKQRVSEYKWTKHNYLNEYCCAKMQLEFMKEDGIWRLVYSDYYLGLYETEMYDNTIYGDLV